MDFGNLFSSIGQSIVKWVPIIGLITIIGGVIYFFVYKMILKPKKYPLIGVLYENINGRPVFAGMDRIGMFRTDDGIIDYRLMNRKLESIKPADYEFMIPSKNGKNVIHLVKIGDKIWFPINLSSVGENLFFQPVEVDMRNWHLQMNTRLIRKFQTPNWWKDHKSEVIFIMAILGTIIIYFMMWKYAPGTVSAIKSSGGNIVGKVTEVVTPSNIPN